MQQSFLDVLIQPLAPERVGEIFLMCALLFGALTFVLALTAQWKQSRYYIKMARNGVWVTSALVLLSAVSLWVCLFAGRYHVEYVYSYSNSTMPWVYKFAALWGGQNGSLLFWLLILCVYSSVCMWQNRRKNYHLLPMIIATLMAIAIFFLVLVNFDANPFAVMPYANVANGNGLNPLLQNFYMLIHPPSLYLGFVGMSVPFAFAMAALITGHLDNRWIVEVRIWTLIAWFFLSVGNLLGSSWAYEVLGWGGYWAWDPVENAAFIPWLTASAFLHSAIIQEKRGMLKTWNMSLAILSFIMTMVGTFLTRSGIVSSVHSFAQSNIGTYFLVFLVVSLSISVGFLLLRLRKLESANELDSVLSRESAFLFNNLVLVGMAFAILWGTLFPVLSEWVRGTKITVGAPYFNSIMIPVGLLLLLLTGLGPLIPWRKSNLKQLKQHFYWPVLFMMITSIAVLLWVPKTSTLLSNVYVNMSFSLCVFVLITIFMEYKYGADLRRKFFKESYAQAILKLLASNRRRYGGYIVHIGIVLMFVGFTGNAFRQEKEMRMQKDSVQYIKNYTLQYKELFPDSNPHREKVISRIHVWKNKKYFGELLPSSVFYTAVNNQEPQRGTEVSILRSLKEDVYAAMVTFDPNNESIFLKIIINPLVEFIWIGGLFMILGSLIVMWPVNVQERKSKMLVEKNTIEKNPEASV